MVCRILQKKNALGQFYGCIYVDVSDESSSSSSSQQKVQRWNSVGIIDTIAWPLSLTSVNIYRTKNLLASMCVKLLVNLFHYQVFAALEYLTSLRVLYNDLLS